jgi:hypothetical protein
MKNTKEILWSVLEKYDGVSAYSDFCDSLSRFIQGSENSDDLIVVYNHLLLLDSEDTKKIDSVIGDEINCVLFSID